MNVLEKTDKIINENLTEIDFKRVYIPKKPEDAEKLAELPQTKALHEISRKEVN